jgi:hypothetical protein
MYLTDHLQAGQDWSQKSWEDLILKVILITTVICGVHVQMYMPKPARDFVSPKIFSFVNSALMMAKRD